ncbi:MAG: Sigma 54 modulation protein/ribosomal protein S30EA [Leptospirillum sp. Group IV 'UBA BS']|nr:MAG: Sigma 54 modulation protein/ribosomal protein S30EA [Leptospirillum sp. Group IV 'UBA BS']
MSLEDAIVQMELLDKDFFLYLDPVSQTMRLLYRRRDGSLGQIEPV